MRNSTNWKQLKLMAEICGSFLADVTYSCIPLQFVWSLCRILSTCMEHHTSCSWSHYN